jgi:hypothetical protein
LIAPSLNVLGEAGILAGLAARLSSIESGREQALLNDATLYLQAVENGLAVLTYSKHPRIRLVRSALSMRSGAVLQPNIEPGA